MVLHLAFRCCWVFLKLRLSLMPSSSSPAISSPCATAGFCSHIEPLRHRRVLQSYSCPRDWPVASNPGSTRVSGVVAMDVQSRPKHSWDPCLCFRAPCSVCVSVVRAPLFDSCVCFASRLQGNGGSPFPKRKMVRRRGQNEKANEGASENVRSLSLGASGGARHRCHPKSDTTRQPPPNDLHH